MRGNGPLVQKLMGEIIITLNMVAVVLPYELKKPIVFLIDASTDCLLMNVDMR